MYFQEDVWSKIKEFIFHKYLWKHYKIIYKYSKVLWHMPKIYNMRYKNTILVTSSTMYDRYIKKFMNMSIGSLKETA